VGEEYLGWVAYLIGGGSSWGFELDNSVDEVGAASAETPGGASEAVWVPPERISGYLGWVV